MQFNIVLGIVRIYALIVIIYGHGKCALCVRLTNHVLIQYVNYVLGLGQILQFFGFFGIIIVNNILAQFYAVRAYVYARSFCVYRA